MKRNTKKLGLLLIATLLAVVFVTACSGIVILPPTDVETISVDVKAALRDMLPGDRTINDIEIVETETDEEEKWHGVGVRVKSSDAKIAHLEYYALMYERNEEKQWVLTDFQPAQRNLWTKTPLAGADDSLFRDGIMWLYFSVEGDDWNINEDSLKSVTVSSRNTQLEQGRDSIILDVVLHSTALAATGQIEVNYTFNDQWHFEGNAIVTPFTSEPLPHAVLDMTDDMIIGKLVELRQFVFSSRRTEQHVQLNRDQISNISLISSSTTNMGTRKTFEHKFNLEKELVTFEIEVNSVYNFDGNSWTLENMNIIPKVTDVRLDGTVWGGVYTHTTNNLRIKGQRNGIDHPRNREFLMEISQLPAIEAIRATLYDLTPPVYSMHLFGRSVNFDDLSFNLEFEDWIVEAAGFHYDFAIRDSRVTFIGFINVEDSTLVDTGSGYGINKFNVMIRQEAMPTADDVDDDGGEENDDDDDDD